jgi:hypothetical protein
MQSRVVVRTVPVKDHFFNGLPYAPFLLLKTVDGHGVNCPIASSRAVNQDRSTIIEDIQHGLKFAEGGR